MNYLSFIIIAEQHLSYDIIAAVPVDISNEALVGEAVGFLFRVLNVIILSHLTTNNLM